MSTDKTAIQITDTTKAWATNSWTKQLLTAGTFHTERSSEECVNDLSYSHLEMSTAGWTEVGTATITVTLYTQTDMVAKELEGLNTLLQNVRAENQQRENAILDRISKLQCLEMS